MRRNVNEHETELTVMKLPTKDVESMCKDPEEFVLLDSKSTGATFKDQPFLGQTEPPGHGQRGLICDEPMDSLNLLLCIVIDM